MVKIIVKSVKSDETCAAEDADGPEPEGGEEPRIGHTEHMLYLLRNLNEGDPDEPIVTDGIKTTLTPAIMHKVMNDLPDSMSTAGFILLVVNIMAAYSLLPRTPQVVMTLMSAIAALKDEAPILFEENGLEKLVRQYEERNRKN